ncbi:Pantothenate synthetase [Candidatus Kinetoplastibacterium sorsogonicusi]|uniref:Pantothenate synthetase n=1 Tax=Candidatus Kinetoplastidibacterium kentomonadis TaxID=1576550 RepID=A0A3Q8ERN5_9PROT|nr:pantoate--beta-alanine ligase [Candidatus Kinetoplastibacterium sorsogonicusi]AWD32703.1 Pantothenate synthetase [Candidatus Kinetoplastibacterium sorsogonicusi]
MLLINTIDSLKNYLNSKNNIVFIPTMGSLHEGHIALIELAKEYSDNLVVSIFVNPLQFSENEDFDLYPRNFPKDIQLLESLDISNILFIPNIEDLNIGKNSFAISVPSNISNILEGSFRKNFLSGMCTIILKFLLLIKPNMIVLGKKDYQQMIVIEQMCKNLFLPTKILKCDTKRDISGLAKSSRNVYLNIYEKQEAAILYKCLLDIKSKILSGTDFRFLETQWINNLEKRNWTVDYLSIRNKYDLSLADYLKYKNKISDLVILIAARLGNIRLIDNLEISN